MWKREYAPYPAPPLPLEPPAGPCRLRVTFRRLSCYANGAGTEISVFEKGDLKIDCSAGCVYLNGEQLHLTPIEYKLLRLLAKHVVKVLTHSYITKEIRCFLTGFFGQEDAPSELLPFLERNLKSVIENA